MLRLAWILACCAAGSAQVRWIHLSSAAQMTHGHSLDLADLDGDGRLDILGKPYTWNAPRVDIWLNRQPVALR